MSALDRLRRDERGTTLVELAFVIALFLLIFFALLDFGRLAYNWVTAEKAMQIAARMAAVRPPACVGLPEKNAAHASNTERFGTDCGSGAEICVAVAEVTCTGTTTNPTSAAIWARIGPLMPGNASVANLRYRYTYDPDMNFLGGPFVPVVTVELQNLQFEFASPLLGLARVAGAADAGTKTTYDPLSFPSMSVSLPGEDLALGDAG